MWSSDMNLSVDKINNIADVFKECCFVPNQRMPAPGACRWRFLAASRPKTTLAAALQAPNVKHRTRCHLFLPYGLQGVGCANTLLQAAFRAASDVANPSRERPNASSALAAALRSLW